MNREEAIAIIRKEYLCVDRDCDIERNCGKCDLMMPSKEPILEAYSMAIKALEQEPCDTCGYEEGSIYCKEHCPHEAKIEQEPKTDSWSIKDVVDTFKKHGLIREQEPCEDAIDRKLVCAFIAGLISDDVEREKGLEYIRSMPPVNPQEPKTGTWEEDIDNSRRWDKVRFYCSECGRWQTYGRTDYCPSCGARMIEPQERSDKE